MAKRIIFIILGVLIVAGAGGCLYYFKFYQKPSSNLVNPLSSPTQTEAKLTIWQDPAGFKFSYPEDIKIDDHPEDEENYAHLELTSVSHPGSILVWMKDNNYQNIQDWVKNNTSTSSAQAFDSDLGDHPAQKLAFANPQKMMTAALDGNAIAIIEVYPQDSWWNETYNQILSSFEFTPLQGEITPPQTSGFSGQNSGGGLIDEGEETVE